MVGLLSRYQSKVSVEQLQEGIFTNTKRREQ